MENNVSNICRENEVFTEEQGFLVSEGLYSGDSTSKSGIRIGYLVKDDKDRFIGLLNQDKKELLSVTFESLKSVR